MNTQPKATDVVNFVMKNGEFRPLLVVRAWQLAAPVTATVPVVTPRPGEQVKFPGHNQPSIIPVAHVNGVLTIDPAVDGGNVPGIDEPATGKPATWPLNRAALEAAIARGKAPNATVTEINAGTAAAKELDLAGPAPLSLRPPAGGIDFRNRTEAVPVALVDGSLDFRDQETTQKAKRVVFDPDEFHVWIDGAAYDDQAKVPGTWHWPKG
jgi:hypothetical protein